MRIEFSTAGDNNYAMTPQIEKRGTRRVLQMAQYGCTHFLLISAPLNMNPDLADEALKNGLLQLGDNLTEAKELSVPGLEMFQVTCVSYMAFRKENGLLEIPDKAANYAVCGGLYSKDEDVFYILLPRTGMSYHTSVAVEISYSMRPHVKEVKKLFRTEREQTPFYEVNFEKKSSYVDGSIVYTIGKRPYSYPLTEQMMGKTILIRTDGEIPKFKSTSSGVILKTRDK